MKLSALKLPSVKLCFSDLKRLNVVMLCGLSLNESINTVPELDDSREGGCVCVDDCLCGEWPGECFGLWVKVCGVLECGV